MHHSLLSAFLIISLVKATFAVQCTTNPCELGGDFVPPRYECLQATDNVNNVICTCPDGHAVVNARCRICESVNCGLNGICIEKSFFPNLEYACGCTNGTYNYLNPGPCSNVNPITTTLPPTICFNGGVYNPATGVCTCLSGYTGTYCETLTGSTNCQNVVCANGGICNPTPTVENGVLIQCQCPSGFFGANCESVGVIARCTPGFCQNGGICEERASGATIYAYCRCPAGFSGQCCQTPYFSCPGSGVYADPVNCKYGRYFQCSGSALTSLSCPRGLRYNFMKMQCDSNVSCPP